ncbi:MAG: HAD family hydrolase [Clostridium sp.]|nr:HAD family hydrolase [Clostridium sp.]
MTHKIIFFDIDGTLLSETTHKIPESAKLAVKNAQENGHLLFINTGRGISNIVPSIKEMNFDGYVCGCGTYIEFKGKELFSKSFSNSFAREMIDDMHEFKIDSILEGKSGIYFDNDDLIYEKEVAETKERNIKDTSCKVKSFYDESLDFDKLVIWTNPNSSFDKFYDKYKDTFDFIHRENNFYELVPLGYSKATGIEFLINELDIDFNDTYALGDSTNDLTMLEYVKNSVAMGNSNPKLFDLVSYVTSDIEEDGVYNALKHYDII